MLVMITNTIVPYCYDIPHLLGLPEHLSHRFRYRNRWIALRCEVPKIIGRRGMIVLRDFDTGRLLPMRYVEIEDVLSVGDIHYIEFRLLGYVSTSEWRGIEERLRRTIEKGGSRNTGGEELESLVFETDETSPTENDAPEDSRDREEWSSILVELGKLACYKDFGFLKILHLRGAKEGPLAPTLDETGSYSFALKPNHLYFLELLQQVPWEIDKKESIEAPYDVELRAEADEVVILRRIQRVVGKYDLLRFIFKTPTGYATKHTFLEVENRQMGDVAKHGLPALFIPIRIRVPDWMRILLWSRTGLAVLSVIGIVASELLSRLLTIGADWVRALALLFLVLATGNWHELARGLIKEANEVRLR